MAASFLSWGTTPHRTDTINTLLKRIAGAESSGGGGGSTNLSGSGSPINIVTPTAANQWYRDTDTDSYYWATGLTSDSWHLVI